MNESSNKRAVVVGIFVVVGLAFLITGILMVGSITGTFKEKMHVTSFFDEVSGLQKGHNVWFSGVKVGTVKDISLHGNSQVEVQVNIETSAQEYIRKDAKIKIGSDGLIGNKILVIYGGTAGAAKVSEGDTLTVEKTFDTEDMVDMLQENNKNILAITDDFKQISSGLAAGEGSLGKLLKDDALYDNMNATALSLRNASLKTEKLLNNLNTFTAQLNQEGTLINDLMTDTVVFESIKGTLAEVQQIADTAAVFISDVKALTNNPNTSMGVLLHDEEAGADLKQLIENLESSSVKLDENMEALQSNFLFRRYFRKKEKREEKAMEAAQD